jgi:hypothetical protein
MNPRDPAQEFGSVINGSGCRRFACLCSRPAGILFLSATMADIHQVTIINGGMPQTRTGGGIIHLEHGSGYGIPRGNTVNEAGGRRIHGGIRTTHARIAAREESRRHDEVESGNGGEGDGGGWAVGTGDDAGAVARGAAVFL